MNEKKQSGTYRTGTTAPRKNRVGVLAILLTITTFLCGLSAIFNLLRINLLQKFIDQTENQTCVMAFEKASPSQPQQGSLHIQGQSLDTFWQSYYHLPEGIYVSQCHGQPLHPGDILLYLDNAPVPNWESLNRCLSQHVPGEKVIATVQRDGQTLQLELTIYK